MKRILVFLFVGLLFFTSCSSEDKDDDLKMQIQRITNDPNKHQAFTDLVFFDNQFFLTFRESDKHVFGENGTIKLMKSQDGVNWVLLKEFSIAGIDLRDPKFTINGDELMLYIHGSTFQEKAIVGFYDYRLKYSDNWGVIEKITLDNKQQTTRKIAGNEAWPWRVTWFGGSAYSIGYNGIDIFGVYESTDGLFFKNIKNIISLDKNPSECTIRFTDQGDLIMLVRRNFGSTIVAKYDFISKEIVMLGEIPIVNFGGPNFLIVNQNKILFSGRAESSKLVLGVFNLDTGSSKIISTLPSGGDATYPGMVVKDDVLWMSYYSSHENTNGASIYLAKVKMGDLKL